MMSNGRGERPFNTVHNSITFGEVQPLFDEMVSRRTVVASLALHRVREGFR